MSHSLPDPLVAHSGFLTPMRRRLLPPILRAWLSWFLRLVAFTPARIVISTTGRVTKLVLALVAAVIARSPILRRLLAMAPMEWLGRAKIQFTASKHPIQLQNKDGSKTDLLKIVKETTPPCHLNPLLFNGHLQTIWTVTKKHGPQVYYKRRVFDADHEVYHGTFAVDFVTKPFEEADATLPPRTVNYTDEEFDRLGSDDSRPQLVVLHGLR